MPFPAYGLPILALYQIGVFSATTQYLAARFGHHPALGQPLIGDIYPPWAWAVWSYKFGRNVSDILMRAESMMMGGVVFGFFCYFVAFALISRKSLKHDGVHGTAHWASRAEILATGLLPRAGQNGAGVYVGGWADPKGNIRYLRHNGPEHIAVIAPTRSGKGVSLIVPTLLTWSESVLVLDSKGESYNLTAGYRDFGLETRVIRFDPASEDSADRYNFLDAIRLGTAHEVGDAQNIATIIVDPDGKGLQDHWAKTSQGFLPGIILWTMYKARQRGRVASLGDVGAALADPLLQIDQLYEAMQQNSLGPNGDSHPTIAAAGRDQSERAVEERTSVLSTVKSHLTLYRDPLVNRNTSDSTFLLTDLVSGDVPASLYLIINAEDKDRFRPLFRLFITQVVRVLLRPELLFKDGQPVAPYPHRLLMILDEFPSYGRIGVFEEALAYIAGHGIKAMIITQDTAQLHAAYGREETILPNCHIRVAFAPNRIETAEWLSKMAGTSTVVKEDISTSGRRYGAMLSNASRQFHQIARPLLTPDEAMRLKTAAKNAQGRIVSAGAVVVFVAGHAPIMGTQPLYFLDETLSQRAAVAPRPRRARPVRERQQISTPSDTQGVPIDSEPSTPAEPPPSDPPVTASEKIGSGAGDRGRAMSR